jgi:hypothetical protein
MNPWDELQQLITNTASPAVEMAAAPEPVRRYFDHALRGDVQPVQAAVLTMRGHIKLKRWLPFRARQLLAPRLGTVWQAQVGWLITGADRYVAGTGGMDWRLFGRFPVMHATGDDVARSSAERAAAESIWVPAAIPPGSATWQAADDTHLDVAFDVDGHDVTLHHVIDHEGRLRSSSLRRWGDPDNTGTWQALPFGVEVTAERTFDGITIPSAGRVGWHHGTDRWSDGEFFRFTITSYRTIP